MSESCPVEMDPFFSLPPELRLEIFILLRLRRSILQLIQASPVMLTQYTTSKHSIIRTLITTDFDEGMLQDAMGIILFPAWQLPRDLYATLAGDHLDAWAARKLPDPFQTQDAGLIDKLDRFYNRALLLIEDYINEASIDFPPREHFVFHTLTIRIRLPHKNRLLDGPSGSRLDVAELPSHERKRLLKAYLPFYLLGKVGRFVSDNQVPRGDLQLVVPGEDGNPEELRVFRELLTYLESVYEARFAQCADIWLPNNPFGNTVRSRRGNNSERAFPGYDHRDARADVLEARVRGKSWLTASPSPACLGFGFFTTYF